MADSCPRVPSEQLSKHTATALAVRAIESNDRELLERLLELGLGADQLTPRTALESPMPLLSLALLRDRLELAQFLLGQRSGSQSTS